MREREIYLAKISEALTRLTVCEKYLAMFEESRSVFDCESGALQMRKAMEAIAFASIAPNKEQYAAAKKSAEKSADFRNDWNARLIFQLLAKLNADFYPKPMAPRTKTGPNSWHYGEPPGGHMSQKTFEKFYPRLGKFLHADNPWGDDKGWSNMAKEMASAIKSLRKLLVIHRTVIRTPQFTGVWVVEAPADGPPSIFAGYSDGEFVDNGR